MENPSEPAAFDPAELLRRIDATSPLGPVREWSGALRVAVQIVLTSALPMSLWWGDRWCMIGNDAAAQLLGEGARGGGRPAAEVWPEGWAALGAGVAAVHAGRRGDRIVLPGHAVACVPVGDEAGPGGVLGTWLPETDGRVAAAADAAGIGVFELEFTTDTVRWANDRMYEILGRDRADGPLGRREFVERILVGEDLAAVRSAEEAARRGGRLRIVARIRRDSDGEERWVELAGRIEREDGGAARRMVGFVTDVTERVEADRALEDAERRLQAALDGGQIATFVVDVATMSVSSDRKLAAFFNLAERPEARPLEVFLQTIHPDDRPRVEAAMTEAIRTCADYVAEYRLVTFDPPRWVLARGRVECDERGQALRLAGAVVDVTDRKRAEATLDSFFDLALDSLAVASTRDGRWKRVNPAMARTLGWSAEELLETPLIDLVHPDDRPASARALAAVGAGRPVATFEHRMRCKDGSYRWITWNVVPVPEEGLMFCAGRDTTARREAVEALREQDRRKTEFLGVLSHELRNPLSPIKHSLTLLDRAPAGSDTATRAQAVLRRQVEQIERLVDDLLDMTRVSRGKVQLRIERVDVGDLARRAAEDHAAAFEAAEVGLRVERPARPLVVPADRHRIGQVVGNLLTNALKFTPRGGRVVLAVEADGGRARLAIADSGVGIGADLLDRLFEPFVQAEHSLEGNRGGVRCSPSTCRSPTRRPGRRPRPSRPRRRAGACC